jgi:peptidoglycan/xylan/chitin deacetylase (PgdA/CDA1 family)
MPLVIHKIVDHESKTWENIERNYLEVLIKNIGNQQIKHKHNESAISKWEITFDDGNESDYEIAFPCLLSNNLTAKFFIVTDWVGKRGYLSWSQIREMSSHKMIIGSHGHSHLKMTDLSIHEVIQEFDRSKKILEDRIGNEVYNFSFPFGSHNKNTCHIGIKSGYRKIYCSNHGIYRGDLIPIPRNSVNMNMKISDIEYFLNPSILTRIMWGGEDILKTTLKKLIGHKIYKNIRNGIYK